eukprot:scaffold14008_cov119-Isochrysis_galbana.AAC.2
MRPPRAPRPTWSAAGGARVVRRAARGGVVLESSAPRRLCMPSALLLVHGLWALRVDCAGVVRVGAPSTCRYVPVPVSVYVQAYQYPGYRYWRTVAAQEPRGALIEDERMLCMCARAAC